MVKDKETKEKIEREYVIPLREKCRSVARYKKTNKAVKTIKEFLVRHMKIRDRDLNKIKLDMFLNEYLWNRGIKNPPHKVKVKAIKEGDLVRVELLELPTDLKFKKARLEKREQKAEASKKPEVKAEEKKEETAEEKEEFEEKKEAVIEEGAEKQKAAGIKKKKTSKKPEVKPEKNIPEVKELRKA